MSGLSSEPEAVGDSLTWHPVPAWMSEYYAEPNEPVPPDVTEAEWLSCTDDPARMVEPFDRARERLASGDATASPRRDSSPSCREWRERKARLLAVGAVSPLHLLFPGSLGGRVRALVAAVARRADGLATGADVDAAFEAVMEGEDWEELADGTLYLAVYALQMAWQVVRQYRPDGPARLVSATMYAMEAAAGTAYRVDVVDRGPFRVADVMTDALEAAGYRAERGPQVHIDHSGHARGRAALASQLCHLTRDVFGNPFRPVRFDPAWRTSPALALARQMYERRDFCSMPSLADALQDAGCSHPAVLEHCFGTGAHVRGCWVVDLVLGNL